MDLKKLTDKAKDLVEKRGGTESLKEDAGELKGIAKSQGSFADKAKAAVAAIKDPGDEETARPAPAPAAESTPAPEAKDSAAEGGPEKVEGEHRGKHGQGGHGRGGQGRHRGGRDGDPAV
jgi:hypothetical protein